MSVNQTCFTRETLVATENGQIKIDEIKAGDKAGIHEVAIRKYELGKNIPKSDQLRKIADAFNMPFS